MTGGVLRRHGTRVAWVVLASAFAVASTPRSGGAHPDGARDARVAAVQRTVRDIQRADYRGDLRGLERGRAALERTAHDSTTAEPARYWRAFALWREALNRMSTSHFDRSIALHELRAASDLFLAVSDPRWVADAQSAAAGCLMSVKYLLPPEDPESAALIPRFAALTKSASTAAPDNPRVLWILGGQRLYTPPEYGGGRAAAIATYEHGLRAAREAAATSRAPLTPAWGEAELLMALARLYSTSQPVDDSLAEAYAHQALALEPDWRYVRKVLLPDIVAKRHAPSR